MSNESENERIELTRYEGHSPAPWRVGWGGVYCDDKDPSSYHGTRTRTICKQPLHFDKENGDWVTYDVRSLGLIRKHPDQLLIADAPLILDAYNKKCKEVKQLREGIKAYLDLDIETHELKALIDE